MLILRAIECRPIAIAGAVGVICAVALTMGFAWLNSGQLVVLRLGLVTLYGVPLTVVAFGSVLAGMLVMLVAGIRSDLSVRRILRARLEAEDREEDAGAIGAATSLARLWRTQGNTTAAYLSTTGSLRALTPPT